MIVKIKRLPELGDLSLPVYAHLGDSGRDIRAAIDDKIIVKPFEVVKIPTGFALELPFSVEGQIRARSGLASKGILVQLATIDSNFTGHVIVVLQNLSGQDFEVCRGDRIAQLVIAEPIHYDLQETDELKNTSRGVSGLGSTGIK